ncbi:hypothetical protein M422DRAFT_23526 [Sphaerobolus stellatus SS14]|nr:hypothetical protein M422DRAFT_23526 [Sphaerobolus stellatus SS14]
MNNSIRRIVPHAELTEQWHARWEQIAAIHEKEENIREIKTENLTQEDVGKGKEKIAPVQYTNHDQEISEDVIKRKLDEDTILTERVLELAISLEWRARNLLISHLGGGDDVNSGGDENAEGARTAQIILKADRNVQLRAVKLLLKGMEDNTKEWQGVTGDPQRDGQPRYDSIEWHL